MIENYKFKYPSRGKFFFVPTDRCEQIGQQIIRFFSNKIELPEHFYHYRKGGHVAALHSHVSSRFFFKIDIQNFYYSIARMRVTRALRHWKYPNADNVAKWSCVRNPGTGPEHSLPIGFVQSPLLASLVLMRSPVNEAIKRAQAKGILVSVYLDDFIGSHDDFETLTHTYNDILTSCEKARFTVNMTKLISPNIAVKVFNCNLTYGAANVTEERNEKYYSSTGRTPVSDNGFEQYKMLVASQNTLRP